MPTLKQLFKRNTHNALFGALAGLGRSINRMYENRNHDIQSNGEAWLIQRLAQLQPKVVFDVGANTGKYCTVVKQFMPQVQVFCFEPVASTYEILSRQVANLTNVTLIRSGLYSEPKKLIIHKYPSHTHASLFELKAVPYEAVGEEEIDLQRGDDIIAQHGIKGVDLLKLDIEGAEMGALTGFTQALANRTIRCIQFEYGYINITTKNLLVDYYEFLGQYGYLVGKLYPRRVVFRPYAFKHEDFIGPNMVAVHRDDAELLQQLG